MKTTFILIIVFFSAGCATTMKTHQNPSTAKRTTAVPMSYNIENKEKAKPRQGFRETVELDKIPTDYDFTAKYDFQLFTDYYEYSQGKKFERNGPDADYLYTYTRIQPDSLEPILAELVKRGHSTKEIEHVRRGEVFIGMSEDAVRGAKGWPDRTNRTVTAYGESKQLVYEGYSTEYIYIEDGKVRSWQD